MDKLLIPDIPLQARVGCTEQERSHPQTIQVDLELSCCLKHAARVDSIAEAIDYVAVQMAVAEVATCKKYYLIETIAAAIAASLLEQFSIESVRVRVKKPSALAEHGVPWAGVEIVRNRSG